jgi:glycosyltransferase involved in cell wall biosynthesis
LGEAVTICLPVLNEVEVINEVVIDWLHIVSQLPIGSSVLVEDGGSKDGTVLILKELQKKNSLLDVIYREKPDGFGNAAKRLLGTPETEWVFFTDSDGQYVPEDFWILWNRRLEYDLVRGIKMGRQDPFFRRVTSFFWNKSVGFLFNLPLIDINAAFVLAKSSIVKELLPSVKRLSTLVTSELIIRFILGNYEVKNSYVRHRKRSSGKSRGIPTHKLPSIAIRQFLGLWKIKSDYRI